MSGILGARKTKEGRRERGASGGDFGKKAFRADCDDGQGLRAMQDLNCTSQKVKKGEAAALINHFMICKIHENLSDPYTKIWGGFRRIWKAIP